MEEERFDVNGNEADKTTGNTGATPLGEKNAGTATTEEKTTTGDNTGAPAPGTTITANIEKNQGKVQAAGQISNNEYKQYFFGDEKRIIKRFSCTDSFPLDRETLLELRHTFVYPDTHMEFMMKILVKWRLLLITGEKHSGKYETARYLAMKLQEGPAPTLETRYVEPPTREIDIDIIDLIRESSELEEKILLFKNALANNNPGLMDFFKSCNRATLGILSRRLAEINAYMIFTTDDETYKQHEYTISELPFQACISAPDAELLNQGMEKKLNRFCTLNPRINLENARQLVNQEKEKILRHFKRMSQVTVFIEDYLEKILGNEKTMDEAIVEVNHMGRRLEHWFLKDLREDKCHFEVWTFALCLTLFNYSKYTDFYDFHREITRQLLQHYDPFKTYNQFSYTLSESDLLMRCHAQIIKELPTYSDTVKFIHEDYQKELMEILLKNSRNVLLFIVPILREYVGEHTGASQRRLAAISLGRIGVMDPWAIVLPVIDLWAKMEDKAQRANVGYLFEGIINSGDPAYISMGLRKLEQMVESMDIDLQWTAIAAYKQIGYHDLDTAMTRLRYLHDRIVKEMFEKQTVLDFIYSQAKLLDEDHVLAILDRIYAETNYLLSAVRYSIVALAVVLDPIAVLDKLKIWIHEGSGNTRVNIVLFCMGNDGIFKELESREIINWDTEKTGEKMVRRSNPLLFYLTGGDEPIEKMAAFLRDLYSKCLGEFRMDIKKSFKALLFGQWGHFKLWAEESLDNPRTTEAVKKLLLEFYKSGDKDLKTSLWDYMNRWKASQGKENQLMEFVQDLSKQFFM
jgi:hypothetical protein